MRSILTTVALAAVAASGAFAQMQDNQAKRLSCDDRSWGDREHSCEIREQTMAATGRLDVDSGPNGGATIKGWLRNEVLVRARIDASGDTQAEARALGSQVQIAAAAGQVRATGPQTSRRAWWSVSYEIFVPQNTDLTLKTLNGGITISDVRGRMDFSANNGGVHLSRIAGDVKGATVNGGVHIELAGNSWDGRQLEVATQNGGVHISMPGSYSAHVQTETVNGRMRSDFPVAAGSKDFNVGSGGALIHVSTTNGGIELRRL